MWTCGRFTTRRALVYEGSSQGSCIQKELFKDAPTTHKLKCSPTTMIMADGNRSSDGPITHFDRRTLRIAGHIEQLALDIAPLSHPLILGMPWLRKNNPRIDFHNDIVTFDSTFCLTCIPHRTLRKFLKSKPVFCGMKQLLISLIWGIQKIYAMSHTEQRSAPIVIFCHYN